MRRPPHTRTSRPGRFRLTRTALLGARLPAVLLLVLSSACSTYSDKVAQMRGDLYQGDPVDALAELEGIDEDHDDLPYLMEKGLLQYLNGDLDACQESFAHAEVVVDDLFTKSLSREFARLIVNDSMQAYRGEIFERVWIHYYRALAFLAAGDVQSAAVEGRAVTVDLQRFADAGPDEAKYRNDPFLQYFAGLLYELDGELNDAWINYREAERLYEAVDIYGVATPDALISNLFRAGERLGFDDLLAPYLKKYPVAQPVYPAEGEGELVLLVSTGLIPQKISNRIDFPIFKETEGDPDRTWDYANVAYDNWRYGGGGMEIDYILSIALPAVETGGGPPPRLFWEAAGDRGPLELGADLGALNRQCLEDRYGGVVIRTVARALLKYWGKEEVEDEYGGLAGFLADLLGSATEVADTRGWSTLPAHVHIARLCLPAGEQMVSVEMDGLVRSARVEIEAGQLTFQALRLY